MKLDLSRNYFICIINDLNVNKTSYYAIGLCRNLMEYFVNKLYLRYNNLNSKIFPDITTALDFLKKSKHDHAVFLHLGTLWYNDFLLDIDNLLDKTTLLLNFDDQFYYPFYVNAKRLKNVANEEIFANSKKFPNDLKNKITYLFPHDEIVFHQMIQKLKQHLGYNKQTAYFFPFNTESYQAEEFTSILRKEKISYFATVAAGLNHLKYLKDAGYNDDLEILFYDSNAYALWIMEKIYTEWDCKDYPKFIDKFSFQGPNSFNQEFINNNWLDFLTYFNGEDSWLNWFTKFKETAKISYVNFDLLGSGDEDLLHFVNTLCCDKTGCKILWLSNIFFYEPNNISWPLKFLEQKFCLLLNLCFQHDQSLLVQAHSPYYKRDSQFFTCDYNLVNYVDHINNIFNW